MCVCVCVCVCLCLFVRLFVCLFVRLFVCLVVCLFGGSFVVFVLLLLLLRDVAVFIDAVAIAGDGLVYRCFYLISTAVAVHEAVEQLGIAQLVLVTITKQQQQQQ